VFVRAGKEALDDHATNLAAALAYYAFLAIAALLLWAVGACSLFAGPTRSPASSNGSQASSRARRWLRDLGAELASVAIAQCCS